jgi:hypothetical protein
VTTKTLPSVAAIDPIAIAALRRRMQGELLTPDTAGYNSARQLANLRYDRRPALITRCQLSRDVSAAVAFAREHDLEIAVRSGGHSIPGHSAGDGGMMIDLSKMKRRPTIPTTPSTAIRTSSRQTMVSRILFSLFCPRRAQKSKTISLTQTTHLLPL